MKTDVVIIGAGVVGCAVARELTRFNVNVTVLEGADAIQLVPLAAKRADRAVEEPQVGDDADPVLGKELPLVFPRVRGDSLQARENEGIQHEHD